MYKNKDQECGVEDRSFISKSVKCILAVYCINMEQNPNPKKSRQRRR